MVGGILQKHQPPPAADVWFRRQEYTWPGGGEETSTHTPFYFLTVTSEDNCTEQQAPITNK
jgi:hypothetical protein